MGNATQRRTPEMNIVPWEDLSWILVMVIKQLIMFGTREGDRNTIQRAAWSIPSEYQRSKKKPGTLSMSVIDWLVTQAYLIAQLWLIPRYLWLYPWHRRNGWMWGWAGISIQGSSKAILIRPSSACMYLPLVFVHYYLCFLSSLSLKSITLSALNWEYCWSLTLLLNRLCLNIWMWFLLAFHFSFLSLGSCFPSSPYLILQMPDSIQFSTYLRAHILVHTDVYSTYTPICI